MDRVDDDTNDDDSKDDDKKDKKTAEIDYTGGNGWLLEVTYVAYDFDGGELSVKVSHLYLIVGCYFILYLALVIYFFVLFSLFDTPIRIYIPIFDIFFAYLFGSQDVYVNLGKKTNQQAVQASLALAEIGKGNEPKLGSYTVNAMRSTEQPTGAPVKNPKSPTKYVVASCPMLGPILSNPFHHSYMLHIRKFSN